MLKEGFEAKRIPEPLFYARFHGANKTAVVRGTKERFKILTKHNFLDVLEEELLNEKKEKEKLKKEIQMIKNSKFWKARERCMKIKKKLTGKK
jgi:hypothetical protein